MLVKKDATRDILTVMSNRVTVKFKIGENVYETEVGQWCHVCRFIICMECIDILLTLLQG